MKNDIDGIKAELRLEIESYSSAKESANNYTVFKNIVKNMAYINKTLDSDFKLGRFNKLDNNSVDSFKKRIKGLDIHTQMMINGYEDYILNVENIRIEKIDDIFFLLYSNNEKKKISFDTKIPDTYIKDEEDYIPVFNVSSTIIPEENKVLNVYLSVYGKYFVIDLKEMENKKK